MDVRAAKQRLCAAVDEAAPLLLDVSHELHAHPELCFEEHRAHDLLAGALEDAGLTVRRGAYELATAFAADAGHEGSCVAVMCEYDALPEIGHACGHNVIGAAGLGAGLAAAAVADEAGGRVRVLGTPAEEGGGGKVLMARQGALEGVDAALMVHPAAADLDAMDVIAIRRLRVLYQGVAAHAAAAPHEGRNALDAAVIGYTAVGALRQHIRDDERIHGIFTRAGDKANVVPATAECEWYVRAGTLARLEDLVPRVEACLRAGAQAAGCTVEVEALDPVYADMISNAALSDCYRANAEALGRTVHRRREAADTVMGSTDMGNVSYEVPSIHPMIQVAPPGTMIHTPEFADHAIGPDADRAVLDGAKAMAMTIADVWLRPEVLAAVRHEFSVTATSARASR
jgi:amidohydrolase